MMDRDLPNAALTNPALTRNTHTDRITPHLEGDMP